ncbi:FAD binding domain-containing protein [Panaeolus papilionaceus]|nr:FAD binding domain-containing protein [Panaeolus papilionaceus]
MPSAIPSSIPPNHSQVLIIGGGPAGSYAAAALAREGVNVTLLEASKFPRYHVGESLIPSVRHYLRFIGAEEKVIKHGFISKPGSAIKFNQFKREGYTDFVALGCNNNAWNVVRSEFDQLLLNHARASGATVYEQTKVEAINFTENMEQPISVNWVHTPPSASLPTPPASPRESGFSSFLPSYCTSSTMKASPPEPVRGQTSFDYVIDATGRAGILSTRYFKNRHFNASLKNIAVWGYWRNVGQYGKGTKRFGAPWFEALTDESGWAWFIPLHDGTTSIGVVMNEKAYKRRCQEPLPPSPFHPTCTPFEVSSMMTALYLANISLAPGLMRLVTDHSLLKESSVRSASDFSYSAPSYAGYRYRIIGDAGAFIDPFFSSGVHLAMTSALSSAATVCASIRRHCSEDEAATWHTRRVSTSYTRFQVVVLSAYKQIQSQSDDILSDIDEDNYDRAFAFLRPVIQGASDMGARLSETELQRSLDFCVNLFNPTSPEQHERLALRGDISQELLDIASPIVDPDMFEQALHASAGDDGEESDSSQSSSRSKYEKTLETKMILDKINARRIVHSEYYINNLEIEQFDGLVVRLERGKLGLRPL